MIVPVTTLWVLFWIVSIAATLLTSAPKGQYDMFSPFLGVMILLLSVIAGLVAKYVTIWVFAGWVPIAGVWALIMLYEIIRG